MSYQEQASNVRLMGFDIDGVMTDGRLYFNRSEERRVG